MDTFHVLLWLTLLYLVILVIALAAGLIAIARALMITRRNLAQIEEGLTGVDGETRPLAGSLETINTVLTQVAGGLSALAQSLKNSDVALAQVSEKLVARR